MSDVLRHVVESISPASAAHAEGARANLVAANAPVLERLAVRLGAAQHSARPRAEPRKIVVAAGDHGCGDPGIAMGADHPTVIAARAIAEGGAALSQVARSSRTPIVIIDAGAREAMPAVAVRLGRGPKRDLMREPAMTIVDAVLGLEAGIALAVSLAEPPGLAVVALGAIGVGSEVASAAILGAITGRAPAGLGDDVAELAGARGAQMTGAGGVEILAAYGGPETAVLAGLILGAASMNAAVILDGHATGAAALIAAALAPTATGYLIAAHRGNFTHPRILAHLGLEPIFEVGLGHGEGTGAAMVLPLTDQVAAVSGRR
ncbi:MAG: Nicotinate-nucleotide--dimethylbenzimidazolephos phoribosyltransferase [Myxococcales bacterium]|nr:Nicotinate-nucleotide--dimethylbenzimidazolephos phoribosyltransferase [Myxococcales bacterium]